MLVYVHNQTHATEKQKRLDNKLLKEMINIDDLLCTKRGYYKMPLGEFLQLFESYVGVKAYDAQLEEMERNYEALNERIINATINAITKKMGTNALADIFEKQIKENPTITKGGRRSTKK